MRLQFVWAIFVDELFQKSMHPGIGSDTLKKCLLAVSFFVGVYFFFYHFDEQAVRFDHWLHEVFGWELSAVPSARKVELHRLIGAGISLVGIVSSVSEYALRLWRRIEARSHEGSHRS